MHKFRIIKNSITKILAVAICVLIITPQAFAATDISGHWAEEVLTTWKNNGMIQGYSNGSLKPDEPITRVELVQLINKAMDFTEKRIVDFTDVSAEDWYFNAVAIAMGQNYCSGFADNTFRPNQPITRLEAAGFIANAAGLSHNVQAANKFTDLSNTPDWVRGSIGAVAAAGYMDGFVDGTFRPDRIITRAEAITTLNNVVYGVTEDVVETSDIVLSNDGDVIESQNVDGNVTISSALGNGSVYIRNSTISGDLIIDGGLKSINIENSSVMGAVKVNKNGVNVILDGNTNVYRVQFQVPANLNATKDYKGKVDTVTVTKDLGIVSPVNVNVPTQSVNILAKSCVQLGANVDEITVQLNAATSKIEIPQNIKAKEVICKGAAALSGKGTIEKLYVYADDTTKTSQIKINNIELAPGISEPKIYTGLKKNSSSEGYYD